RVSVRSRLCRGAHLHTLCSPCILASVDAPPPTALHTLSLHDALPICRRDAVPVPELLVLGKALGVPPALLVFPVGEYQQCRRHADRKSTRLKSSHGKKSYAVFCLKKKKTHNTSKNTTSQVQVTTHAGS